MANHMAEVAKMFGVELGERFKIYDEEVIHEFECFFSEEGLMVEEGSLAPHGSSSILKYLLCGTCAIKRKPWKPRNGQTYWCVALCGVSPNKWLTKNTELTLNYL